MVWAPNIQMDKNWTIRTIWKRKYTKRNAKTWYNFRGKILQKRNKTLQGARKLAQNRRERQKFTLSIPEHAGTYMSDSSKISDDQVWYISDNSACLLFIKQNRSCS